MMINESDKNLLFRRLNIPEKSANFLQGRKILEINDDNGDTLEYYIGDFRKNSSDIIEYIENLEKENIEMQSLLIFETWEQEQDFIDRKKREEKVAKKRREIENLVKRSRIVYFTKEDEVRINLEKDEGINYLEYIDRSKKGFIFNVSLLELGKLYNTTGKYLFKDNVRQGRHDNKSFPLESVFKETFEIGLYHLYKKKNNEYINEIREYFDEKLLEGYEEKSEILEDFWFHHNGITIFSEKEYNVRYDYISFVAEKVSVINGAQTLTHCFSLIRQIRQEWFDILKEKVEENEDINEEKKGEIVAEIKIELGKMLELLKGKVKLKVIFLFSEDSGLKKSITRGLNTQIPILEEDILGASYSSEEINKRLKNKGIKICRSGEYLDNERTFSVLEFAKAYLIFKEYPGMARNLKKDKLGVILTRVSAELGNESKVNSFSKAIQLFSKIDEWWRKREEPLENERDLKLYDGLKRNGKSYFKSYCWRSYNELVDIELDVADALQVKYEQFINEFIGLKGDDDPINSNDLKKDELYKKYISEMEKQQKNIQVDTSVNEEDMLKEYSKSNDPNSKSKITKSIFAKNYFKNKGIKGRIRTVTIANGKVKESFPFNGDTFSSLHEHEDYPEIYNNLILSGNLTFENSILKKEVEQSFMLVVFYEGEDSMVSKIKVINNFNFRVYLEEAKKAFEETIEAFRIGDAQKFPKSSQKDGAFHIRPKARNSKDTFEFTNGEQEVRRTFWANKDTVLDIINSQQN
ncbi:AIPR family protein [Bacillus paramycoides]|uniref:AIPR family protein n=1 Tax=Bacillus paramycoides TaxID=2026194 RepID=UPI0022431397|nr:AIPR family protein [Bacillus paramycoides]MCW9130868.1 AIPR family protein [Bacillus paramycoides]